MPGISFAYRGDGGASGAPYQAEGIAGYSLTGSTQIYGGDVLALSTYSGVSLSSQPSIRKLLAADKTAQYGGVSVITAPAATGLLSAVTATSYGVPFLANGTYYVQLTYVSATGETVGGTTASQATSGGTQAILVTAPAGATGAVGYKVYASAVGTTTPFFLQSEILSLDQGFAIGGYGASNALLVTGAAPPTVNTSGKIAGIYGVAPYTMATGATGLVTGSNSVGYGGGNLQFPSMGYGIPPDPATGSSLYQVFAANASNVFSGRLDVTSANATPALNQTFAGLILTAGSGNTANETIYTIDTNATAPDQILRILRCEADDQNYEKAQGLVYFQFVTSFTQEVTNTPYSAQ